MLLRDGQVHHDTHPIPMGNYVIAVGNYVSVSPSDLGNYVSADTASLATLDGGPLPRGADVRYCHGRCWTEKTSDRFDDDHLVPDDRGTCKGPPRLPPDCDTPPVRHQGPIWPQGNEHR